jgi:hypothetical protein
LQAQWVIPTKTGLPLTLFAPSLYVYFPSITIPYPAIGACCVCRSSAQASLQAIATHQAKQRSNTIFTVSLQVDATFQANSGHPGAPMGMAPVAHVLFNKFMTFNPKNPEWVNRDRFVLSYVLTLFIVV